MSLQHVLSTCTGQVGTHSDFCLTVFFKPSNNLHLRMMSTSSAEPLEAVTAPLRGRRVVSYQSHLLSRFSSTSVSAVSASASSISSLYSSRLRFTTLLYPLQWFSFCSKATSLSCPVCWHNIYSTKTEQHKHPNFFPCWIVNQNQP